MDIEQLSRHGRAVWGTVLADGRLAFGCFSEHRNETIRRYTDFVADGKNQPGPWEKLKNQIFLGSDEFVANLQHTLDANASFREIPVAQRRPPPKPLTRIAETHGRGEAIFKAYASGGYSLKEIGNYFGLHYSRVSRIANSNDWQRTRLGAVAAF